MVTLNVGDFGIGWNFLLNDDYSLERFFSLLNIGLQNENTNLGLSFSPVKVFGWSNDGWYDVAQSDADAVSLFNLNLYWNVFNLIVDMDINFFLGPFTSVNYLWRGDGFNWNNFIFTTGAHMGLRLRGRSIDYNLFKIFSPIYFARI